MTSERGSAEGASNSSSFTGTKAGAIVSGDPAAPGFSFAAPRRRSRQPSRERRIHLKMRLAFSPCRRATAATEAPEARASSTIRLRSSRLLVVRRRSPASLRAASEANHVKQLGRSPAHAVVIHAPEPVPRHVTQKDVFVHAEIAEKARMLVHNGNAATGGLDRRPALCGAPVDQHRSRVGLVDSREQLHAG